MTHFIFLADKTRPNVFGFTSLEAVTPGGQLCHLRDGEANQSHCRDCSSYQQSALVSSIRKRFAANLLDASVFLCLAFVRLSPALPQCDTNVASPSVFSVQGGLLQVGAGKHGMPKVSSSQRLAPRGLAALRLREKLLPR